MSISDNSLTDRFPGERLRPVGDSRVSGETSDGDVVVPPDLTIDELERHGPALAPLEFGKTPEAVSAINSGIIVPRAMSFGETLVGFANTSDALKIADGYIPEENEPGIIDMVTEEGDIVPVDSDTLGKFNHEPKEYEVPIVDTLTAEEKSQFDSTKADIQRLQLLNGGLSTLLRERLPIDPNYSGGRTELAHRARLSMLRLIGNISWLQNVVAISHPNNDEVRRLVHEISTALTADDIVQLQRVFLGGSKGKNARAEILSHEVGIATRRRGLARPETTRGVCVLGPKGAQLISLVDDIESEV